MKKELLIPVMFFGLILFMTLVLFVRAYVPPGELRAISQEVALAFKITAMTVIIAGGLALALALVGGLGFLGWIGYSQGVTWEAAAQIKKAEVIKARREAGHWQTVAPAGSQIILHDVTESGLTVNHKPGHLAAGWINGHPVEWSPAQVSQWAFFQVQQSINKPPRTVTGPAPAAQLEGSLSPILPLLTQAQRVILAGGSNSGKTTLTKHLIAARSQDSRIVVIDPHSPSKLLGIDVIGAGRKYDKIGQALESLVLLMQERYEDVAKGVFGYQEHPRVSVFIDEWTSIAEEVDHAGRILKTLLTESRKVNIHLVLLAHSTTVPVLGLPDAQIKKSAMIVELTGGNGEPHRAFVQPASRTTPDGRRATPVEYALPGPFASYAQPAGEIILDLPDPRLVRLRQMAGEGKKPTVLAREYFGVDKPNSRQIEAVMKILEENDNDKATPE